MMADRRLTLVLLALTAVVFVVAAPAALREALEHGEFYVFTTRFLADIPKRLAGPGRFRFLLQPALATFLGIRDGRRGSRGPDESPTSSRFSRGRETGESWRRALFPRPRISC